MISREIAWARVIQPGDRLAFSTNAPRHALLASLERALERDANERVSRARRQELERRFAALTDREREELGHVVHGRMNKQIAAALGIHERTVKLHRHAITTKLGVHGLHKQGEYLGDPAMMRGSLGLLAGGQAQSQIIFSRT
jgi:DNA-binding NarL/FixJ family response regulator